MLKHHLRMLRSTGVGSRCVFVMLKRNLRPKVWLLIVLLGMAPSVAGCCCPLTTLMVSCPNRFNPLAGPSNPLPPLECLVADRHLWVPVGPPEATLSVSILEPKGGVPPRGTVLVLHGIFARAITMLPQARALTLRRLSRRPGRSSRARPLDRQVSHLRRCGRLATFRKSSTALEQQQLIAGEIGVMGLSYGATTSIHLAACDPRVQAVVAVEPFAMVRPEIRRFGDVMAPEISFFIPESDFQRAVDRAGATAGFDPDRSDAVDAIQRTSAAVLLLHGTDDWIAPCWNSVVMQEAAPEHSEMVPIPRGGHVSLWFDLDGSVSATPSTGSTAGSASRP